MKFCVVVLLLFVLYTGNIDGQPVTCQSGSEECGWNSQCVNDVCLCNEGYSSQDGADCVHDLCSIEDCLQCLDAKKCSRCKNTVVEGTGECVTQCPYKESLQFHGDFVGRVCTYPRETANLPVVYTAIIGVVSVGIIIAVIIGLACFIHQRRTQGNFDFLYGKASRSKEASSVDANVVSEKYKRDAAYQNGGFASDLPAKVKPNQTKPGHGDKTEFLRQVSELKPHAETFLKMLNDVRKRYRSTKQGNPKATTYKAVMRDLSRVLFILNKKESALKMPPDGNQLMKWAAHSLKNFENCQSAIKTNTSEESKNDKNVQDTPGSVWIESKDETSSLYKDFGYAESKLI
ncbi:uncharacterized protein LOC144435741 [Glandiceps talaboti]